MIQFDPQDIDDLISVDGILARDVDGEMVAIGSGFDYENINEFIQAYIEENGLQAFLENLGYDSIADWLENTPNEDCLYDDCSDAFDFSEPDEYEDEAKREADDIKYARAVGK